LAARASRGSALHRVHHRVNGDDGAPVRAINAAFFLAA